MAVTDEQLKKLFEWFIEWEKTKGWFKSRWGDNERWKQWIDPSAINSLSNEELKIKFIEYFNRGAGRHPFNAIYRDRIVRDIDKFRKTVKYLIDESVLLQERINQVLDSKGKYGIEGMGKGLATSILMDLNPSKYATWNNKTNMGLEALGFTPKFDRTDTWGSKYQKILASISQIRNIRPGLTYMEIDAFLHTMAAEDDGVRVLKQILEKNDISPLEREQTEPSLGKSSQMEFAMENYLEEFIESNFKKIDFGIPLELFQDEENSGRQYLTSIGNIDLLAINETKNVFVVIELKKGKSSDTTVGQILRYMGWVKENLAINNYAGYSVKGIIIAQEGDEKLGYALKFLPEVNVFVYMVSFELKKVQ